MLFALSSCGVIHVYLYVECEGLEHTSKSLNFTNMCVNHGKSLEIDFGA